MVLLKDGINNRKLIRGNVVKTIGRRVGMKRLALILLCVVLIWELGSNAFAAERVSVKYGSRVYELLDELLDGRVGYSVEVNPYPYTTECIYTIKEDNTAEIVYVEFQGGIEFSIPDTIDGHAVTSIGNKAFWYSSYKKIIVPEGVLSIGDDAFTWNVMLESVVIPDSVVEMGRNPFAYCYRLKEIVISPQHSSFEIVDGVLLSKYDRRLIWYPPKQEEEYTIENVKTIDDYAFARRENLRKVIIADGVVEIGQEAFEGCKNLTDVEIADSVQMISAGAFRFCDQLARVTFKDGGNDNAVSIGACAFADCPKLERVILSPNINDIGFYAFYECDSLKSFVIPSSVISVGVNPFQGCDVLSEIIVNELHPTLEVLNGVLYSKNEKELICYPMGLNMTDYRIEKGTKSIGSEAFHGCGKLERIYIPDSVEEIESYAFHGCKSLKDITIPNSVRKIEEAIFLGCDTLDNLTIPGSVRKVKRIASKGLKNIVFEEGVEEIDEDFWVCDSLECVVIPESVSEINEDAFWFCDSENYIVKIKKDSYAERYCMEQELNYQYMD